MKRLLTVGILLWQLFFAIQNTTATSYGRCWVHNYVEEAYISCIASRDQTGLDILTRIIFTCSHNKQNVILTTGIHQIWEEGSHPWYDTSRYFGKFYDFDAVLELSRRNRLIEIPVKYGFENTIITPENWEVKQPAKPIISIWGWFHDLQWAVTANSFENQIFAKNARSSTIIHFQIGKTSALIDLDDQFDLAFNDYQKRCQNL